MRARLRLNRCSLNASLAERGLRGDPPDPNCALCAVPETVDHCLLQCPRYDAPRRECRAALDYLGLPLTLPTVLGSTEAYPSQPPDLCRQALIATGRYLLAIDALRKL